MHPGLEVKGLNYFWIQFFPVGKQYIFSLCDMLRLDFLMILDIYCK